jgi:hypothetical protein
MDEIRLHKLAELGDDVEEHLRRIDNRRGIPSVPWLDQLEPGMLWIHGAYTGHAKTVFALNCAFYWSTLKAAPLNVCFITLEDSLKGLRRRLDRIGIPKPGRLTLLTIPDPAEVVFGIQDYPSDTDILIIDNLLLVRNAGNIGYGRQSTPANLKSLAINKQIAVLATTQTSRHGYARIHNRTFHRFSFDEFRSAEASNADIFTAMWKDDLNPNFLELQWVKNRGKELPDPMLLRFHGNGVLEFGA